MCLWQAINVVVGRSRDAEVLRHIDYLHPLRDGVFLQEGLRLSVAEAEEYLETGMVDNYFFSVNLRYFS